jgi:hypothetical protein
MTQAFNLSQLANNLNTSGQLDATDGLTGAVPVANGGTGLTATPSNGQIDIGNGSGFTRATITAGSGIAITNGSGSITIATSGGGGVTSLNGQTGAITNTSLYAIGSYVTGRPRNTSDYSANTTIAGSSLYSVPVGGVYYVGFGNFYMYNIGEGGSAYVGDTHVNTGTWRCMSPATNAGSGSSASGLWVRIS